MKIYTLKKGLITSILLVVCTISLAQSEFQAQKMVVDGETKWGFVNKKGKWIVSAVYDTVFFNNSVMAGVGILRDDNMLAGVINNKNKGIIPFSYKAVFYVDPYLIAEDTNGFKMVYNQNGKPYSLDLYKRYSVSDSTLTLFSFPSWQIYKVSKEVTDSIMADSLMLCPDGIIAFRNGSKYLVSDSDSLAQAILPGSSASLARNKMFCFDQEYFDCLSKDLPPDNILKNYMAYSNCNEGFIAVEKDGAAGFIDKSGNIRISLQYEAVKAFSVGLAPVKLMGKWGYINSSEELIIQPFYENAEPFCGEVAEVARSGKKNFVNREGKLLNKIWFDQLTPLNTGNWLLTLGDKFGLASPSGRELIIPKYDYVQDTGDLVIVQKHNLYGVLDYNQNFVIPVAYNLIDSPSSGLFFAGIEEKPKVINLPSKGGQKK